MTEHSAATAANTMNLKVQCGVPWDSNEAMNKCMDNGALRDMLQHYCAAKGYNEKPAGDFSQKVFSARFRYHVTTVK